MIDLHHICYQFFALSLVLALTTGISHSLKAQDFDFPEDVVVPDLQAEFIEARMYMLMGQYDQAAEHLEKLLEQDSENAVFLYELARCYNQMNQTSRALEYANRAHRYDPRNSWILQLKANLADAEDRNDLAESAYAKLMELHPERTNYGINRAYHLLLLGQREEAIEVLNQAESISGVNPELTAKKISIFKADNDFGAIEKEYQKLLKAFPRNVDFRMEYGSFLESTHQIELAIEQYQKVLDSRPDHSRARLRIAELETGELEGDERLEALLPLIRDEDVELDEKIQALIPLLMELSEDYQPGVAGKLLEAGLSLIEEHPERAEPRALTGDIAFSSYQFNQAAKLYREALDIRSDVVQVWFNQFESLLQIKDYEKLIDRVNEGLDFYPNQALFFYYLARGQMGIGELETAENTLRRATLMGRRQPELNLYFSLGEATLGKKRGEVEKGIEILNQATEDMPGQADLLLMKADLLLHQEENLEEVATVLDEVQTYTPNHPEYLFARARLNYLKDDKEAADRYMAQLEKYDIKDREDIREWADKISTDPGR